MLNLLTRLAVLVLASRVGWNWNYGYAGRRGCKEKKKKEKQGKKNSRRGTYAFVTTVCHRRTVSVPLFAKTDSATLSDKTASSDRGPFSYGRCGTRFSRWWEIKSRNGGVFFVVMRQTSKRCIYYCYSVRVRNVLKGGRERERRRTGEIFHFCLVELYLNLYVIQL